MDGWTVQGGWLSHEKEHNIDCLELRAIKTLKHRLRLSSVLVALQTLQW